MAQIGSNQLTYVPFSVNQTADVDNYISNTNFGILFIEFLVILLKHHIHRHITFWYCILRSATFSIPYLGCSFTAPDKKILC